MMPALYLFLIAFICAAMNHMGLIAAAEGVIRHKIPVLNCPKCSAFWMTLVFFLAGGSIGTPMGTVAIQALALAFATAYMAVWMELLMGGIDKFYLMLYDAIYPTAAGATGDAPAAERKENPDADGGSASADAVSEVREVTN